MDKVADKRTDSVIAARKLISPINQHLASLAFFPFISQDDFLDKHEQCNDLVSRFFDLMAVGDHGFPDDEKERLTQSINMLVWNALTAHLPHGIWSVTKDYRYAERNLDVVVRDVGEIQMAFEAYRGEAGACRSSDHAATSRNSGPTTSSTAG